MTELLGPTDAEIRKWEENAASQDLDLMRRSIHVLAELATRLLRTGHLKP